MATQLKHLQRLMLTLMPLNTFSDSAAAAKERGNGGEIGKETKNTNMS